jgi:hypothetical protein
MSRFNVANWANGEPAHERARDPDQASNVKVVYVMGAGRSGSTILGVVLGNCADVFYAGELDAWLRRSGVPNFGGTDRSEFWRRVSRQVDGARLFGDQAWRCLEHSTALLRAHRWLTRRQLRVEYRATADGLYRVIAREAGVTHIVDTSHYPLRARELQRLDHIELYLVYLVRDPQHVVASFGCRDVDQPSKSAAATNAYLWLTNALSVLIFMRHPRERRMFLRYEDFLADPGGVLHGILGRIGLPAAPPELTALRTGVPFQGNRLLRSPIISLERTADKRPRRSWLTALCQLPWAAVFSHLADSGSGLSDGRHPHISGTDA